MNATGFISLPGLRAEVRADTTGFIEHLGILFALSEPCLANVTYVITSTSGSIIVRRDNLTLYEGTQEDLALIAIYGDLYEAFVSSSRHFLIHAGSAARQGRAVLMPGAQQSGKSTLTTVLAALGWSAISDDVAVVDPANLVVFPYPRRLLIRPDTLRLNPIVEGALHILGDLEAYGELVHIACTVTPAPQDPVRLAGLVFPRWSNTTTTVRPLSPAETIARVLDNSLNLRFLGYDGVRLAASLTRALPAYELAVRDPEHAIALMSQLDVF